MRVFTIACLTSLLLLWMGLILILDLKFAVSLHLRFYLELAAVALLIVLCLVWVVRRNLIRIFFLLPIALLVILPFIDVSPVKPFTMFYRSLQIGMSDAEVNDLLAKHFPENGPYKPPVGGCHRGGGGCFILDPNDGRYNAELIVLQMDDGKLSSKRYLSD